MSLGRMAQLGLNRLAEIITSLEWPDPPEVTVQSLEKQSLVLRAIAEQPGSAIRTVDPYRAGEQPLRSRTIERLLETGDLIIRRADDAGGSLYITLSEQGWDRAMKVDKR